MALPTVQDAAYPSFAESRDAILRGIAFSFARRGLVANVLPGSDHFIRAEKYASRVSIAIANNQLALADSNPLTATGDALVELAGVFGVSRRPAGPAAGSVTITCTGTVSIPADFQNSAPNGRKYKTVTLSTAIPTGSLVDVIALSGGADTNQDVGTVLTWDSAAIGALKSTCVVAAGGLTGGVDEDDDETLRNRLLDKLAFPPGGGNASQIAEFAEESTASVETASVYQGLRGPASYDVAITKKGGDRTLPAATVTFVKNYVNGQMPGQQDLNLTSVTAQPLDIVLQADMPLPVTGGGPGGGWLDPVPWPAEIGKVTSYSAPTATVNTTAAPVVGQHIGVWDPSVTNSDGTTGLMRTYTVATVGGSSGARTITVDGGFAVSPANAYISAGAENLVEQAALFAAQMALLGPGEKTALPELLPRSLRFPSTQVSGPTDVTTRQSSVVQNAFSEIFNLDYVRRVATGTTTPTVTTPSLPTTTADPPKILTMQYFAIIATP